MTTQRRRAAHWRIALLITFVTTPHLRAAGTSGADFLRIPVGGRPAALGGAYSAAATDAYAPVWNPAGLSGLPATQFAGTHLDYAGSIGYEFASFAYPLSAGRGLGASIQYLHPKTATARDGTGADVGVYSSHYAAYSLAYGQAVNGSLSLGGAVKLIDAGISDVSARAYGADIGSQYRFSRRLSIAAVAANLGTKVRLLQDSQSLPATYRLGMLLSPSDRWNLVAETAYDREDSAFARVGAEWRPVPLLSLRGGYHSDAARSIPGITGLTTGIGIDAFGQRFDYAWAPMGDLGQTQYFSVLLSLGSGAKK